MPTQLILTSNVQGLGAEGDQVTVADGFARNFLLPKSMAVLVTPSELRRVESFKLLRAGRERKELEQAQELARKIGKLNSTVELQTGEKGRAFGSITNADIAGALRSCGFEIDRKAVLLTEPIKQVGIFDIPIRLHPQVNASFKLNVVSPNLPVPGATPHPETLPGQGHGKARPVKPRTSRKTS